jgi:hypothetical protein
MSIKRGDVIKRLAGGVVPIAAHPVIILLILGDTAIFSNITDIEKEDFIHCVLEPSDDPNIITKTSTFRYQDISEEKVAIFDSAINAGKMRNCGSLAIAAFNKIISGSQSSANGQIKPKFRTALKPASAVEVNPQAAARISN